MVTLILVLGKTFIFFVFKMFNNTFMCTIHIYEYFRRLKHKHFSSMIQYTRIVASHFNLPERIKVSYYINIEIILVIGILV